MRKLCKKEEKRQKGKILKIDNSKAECLDPESAKYYKFLGIDDHEQVDNKIKERVIEDCFKRVESLHHTEFYERTMIKALKTMCISVVTYVMNIVNFSRSEFEHLDISMGKTLKDMK